MPLTKNDFYEIQTDCYKEDYDLLNIYSRYDYKHAPIISSFSGSKIERTFAILRISGKHPLTKDRLIISVKGSTKMSILSLRFSLEHYPLHKLYKSLKLWTMALSSLAARG